MLESLVSALQTTSTLEWVSVVFGLIYVILAARENIWCWPAAFIGTATAVVLLWNVSLLMDSALNVYYLAMAVFGWWQWRRGGSNNAELSIQSWRPSQHLITLMVIAILTVVSGSVLKSYTQAAFPFIDSFTTWAAVITTWMVTQKILENWLYWVVIDIISLGLYLQKGLTLYALLFMLYTIIAVVGYINWLSKFRHAEQSA